MLLREMTALYRTKIVVHGAADPETYTGILRSREYLSVFLPLSVYSYISRKNDAITEMRSLNSFF